MTDDTNSILPTTLLVFDIDGVLTDLETSIPDKTCMDILAHHFETGAKIAFNTGRPAQWVLDNVIPSLIRNEWSRARLNNCIIAAEKGGMVVTFDEYGHAHTTEDTSLCIPEAIVRETRSYVEEKLNDSLFFDAAKQTMMTFERTKGCPLAEFHASQHILVSFIRSLLKEHGLDHEFRIDSTVIAVDTEHVTAGKARGAEHIHKWLKDNNFAVSQVVCFGDSKSDEAMAAYFSPFFRTTFVFVGTVQLPQTARYELVTLHFPYYQGTIDYFDHKFSS